MRRDPQDIQGAIAIDEAPIEGLDAHEVRHVPRLGLAQVGAVSDEPQFVSGRGGEVLDGARAELRGEVRGVQVRRAFSTLAREHADDALPTILDRR